MASDTEETVTLCNDEGVSLVKQNLEVVGDRLVSLSEKITLCNRILDDLKDLSDVLVRKSLHEVSLPTQK
ncbi:hypothetical protein ABVT39_003689 [Epinephelus coioides]